MQIRVVINGRPKLKQRSWHHIKGGYWRPPKTKTQKLTSYKGWPLTATHLKRIAHCFESFSGVAAV